ncbi:MAG TPA: M14 family metallocarboxypeptidase [Casimicrobiaceae bacterium]|nr:M14 family metallocarboxypeptidase [Casimicrobiaceae bacterium]
MRLPRSFVAVVVAFVAAAFATLAGAYDEPDAVKSRFPDPAGVSYHTPGFAPGRSDFATHDELIAWISDLTTRTAHVHVRILGDSQEGRSIPMLVLSNAPVASVADVLRLNRPVVWLQGLQHGDEPAGGEAMLAIAERLAVGDLNPLLDRITVLIVPRANPDGAARFTRRTANGIDINRDHVKFDLPETAVVHRAMNAYQPQVVVDCHEFSVANRWIQKWGVVNAYDMTLIYATNPNVPAELTRFADANYRSAITAALDAAGYKHGWYYTTSYRETEKRVQMGGLAPDISRNTFGLQGSISFLLETRGVGIGRDHFLRRVHTHVVALEAVLRTTAANSERVMRTVAGIRDAIARAPAAAPFVVTSRQKAVERTLAMLDPVTGADRPLTVAFDDSLEAESLLVRPRPYAYVLPPAYRDLARRLALNGVSVERLVRPVTLDVDAYRVTDKDVAATTVEGHVRVTVRTELVRRKLPFAAGSYVVRMGQPNALLAAVALEPESASSFVTIGIVPVDKVGTVEGAPSEVPIYRLASPVALALASGEP